MLLVFGVCGCASSPAPDGAQNTGTEPSTEVAENASGDDPDEMICRREQVTGTNFRRRICMTRAQRDDIRKASQEEALDNRSAQRNL